MHGAAFIFYPLLITFWELLLKALDGVNPFWDISLIAVILFSLSAGFLLAFLLELIRPVKLSRVIGGLAAVLLWALYAFEFNCISFYKVYYGLLYSAGMTGQVMGEFAGLAGEVALGNLWAELLFALPLPLYFVFVKKILPEERAGKKEMILKLVTAVVLFTAGVITSKTGPYADVCTYAFSVPASVPATGLLNSLRLELTYAVTGTPEDKGKGKEAQIWTAEPEKKTENPVKKADSAAADSNSISVSDSRAEVSENEAAEETEEAEETEVICGYNASVDFAALIEKESDPALLDMHRYFGSLEPTMQNEYTGMFKGKNLILLTAEAFSPYAVDEQFTPTLYKLANESFVFTDYYQPGWSLSTTGGEFSNITGVIPMWLDGSNSVLCSIGKTMPYAAGNLFGDAGYRCYAFHNSAYDYYSRDLTHPNFGYDYKGIGNGLEMELGGWPYSDLLMMEATIDGIIEESKQTGVPFHAYYMTVSGHCNYSWGANAMSAKHKAEAMEAFPDEAATIQAYKACNKELDLALEYLLARLDEEGILEDTVICMGADHYPYAMAQSGRDYYREMSGIDDGNADISRYKNTLILYCAAIKEPVIVDTPCYSVDIMPTIANLFGLNFDSRLYSGRDIFSTNYDPLVASDTMPLVILPVSGGYSFVTPAGQYDAHKRVFTPKEGMEVSDDYVKDAKAIVSDRWKYSRLLISKDYYSVLKND